MTPSPSPEAVFGGRLLDEIRRRRPIIHHLANFVTMNDVAAATRAVGAMPIMAMSPAEVEEVAGRADALVISLGTPTDDRLKAIDLAVTVARRRGIPVIIDPVGAGASGLRTERALAVIRAIPRPIIRANPAEAAALVGEAADLRGVESIGAADPAALALKLVREGGVAVITGRRDIITDGRRTLAVDNGHAWLAALPGAGCMATAVVGAFAAVGSGDAVTAAAAGIASFGLAAEQAAGRARGPGTLKPALLDALFAMTGRELAAGMRCVPVTSPAAPPAPRRTTRAPR
ncbi:MAG: hydroxyethylthiazole kinase [Armatimonadota bacterium]|nr:hydroxyethylthiazole kinase [Armatimonadota bacterium]MDR7450527.1 hydroxyethylthiazole kinase [Armatimonadota bacterium]MDR7466340.1 hydroxyethylthiazole kinase [Armatimonadota bacterium]MDR7493061.1 hydroxyethylthiazole kinase [Armatimonadota bacterium]MDR7498182.1 hydroxyethylthiazole kinase [Armatimonadota bacterium]